MNQENARIRLKEVVSGFPHHSLRLKLSLLGSIQDKTDEEKALYAQIIDIKENNAHIMAGTRRKLKVNHIKTDKKSKYGF